MPTDTQIPLPAVTAAPADFTVPNTVELRLKAVNALFTDNGAGGDWLPAVVLVSDSGHVISRAVDQGVKVTAGSDAEVSWFPGVKHAAAAAVASANLPWGMGRATSITLASGVTVAVDFALANPNNQFGSSGDGVVTLGAVGGGTTGLIINSQGEYIVSFTAFGTTNAAPAANSELTIACDWDTGDIMAGGNDVTFVLVSGGPARNFYAGITMMLNLDPSIYPIPNTGRVTLRQNTGNNLSVTVIQTATRISSVSALNLF